MLSLVSKNPVKFRWADDLAETAVVLSPDDDQETLVSKLQRLLELAAGGPAQRAVPFVSVAPEALVADRAATEARLAGVHTSGWNEDTDDLEHLPEV